MASVAIGTEEKTTPARCRSVRRPALRGLRIDQNCESARPPPPISRTSRRRPSSSFPVCGTGSNRHSKSRQCIDLLLQNTIHEGSLKRLPADNIRWAHSICRVFGENLDGPELAARAVVLRHSTRLTGVHVRPSTW